MAAAMPESSLVADFMSEVSSVVGGDGGSSSTASSRQWSILEMRTYTELYTRRLKERGDPQPTAECPLPPDSKCKWCCCSRRDRNPIAKGVYAKNLFLPFKSAAANECVPCRMGQLWGFKALTKSELQIKLFPNSEQQLSVENEFAVTYLFVIVCWEVRYIDPAAAIFKNAESLPEVVHPTITQAQSIALVSDMCLGNLWPKDVFTRHFGYEPDKKNLTTIKHSNKPVTGVILSPSFGMQIGVIALTQRAEAKAERSWDLADKSVGDVRPEALDDLWGRAQKRHDVSFSTWRPDSRW